MSEDRTTIRVSADRAEPPRKAAPRTDDEASDPRLDALVTALATTRPGLDDLLRARVGARLAATCHGLAVGSVVGGDPDRFLGRELCGYEVRRKLAEGSTGVVYEGFHAGTGRRGAIKVVTLELCRAEDAVARFHREARAVNALHHPHIVDLLALGDDPGGRVWFVMEYLEGETLAARIRRGPLAWPEAAPILDQTLRALQAAHAHGVVHRDLRPEHIWLQHVDGQVEVKVLGFATANLVRNEGPRTRSTEPGAVLGAPRYLSPEQIDGTREIDHRADIYTMGVIMYEMLVGVAPFAGDTPHAIMVGHLFTAPPRLAALPAAADVPAPITAIVDRMLAKEPSGRYAGITGVLADLHDVDMGQPPGPALVAEAPRAPSTARRRWRWLVAGLALAAAGLALWASRVVEALRAP